MHEVRNLSGMFLTLQKFASKEDKLELKFHDQNLMTKRDLWFDHEDICGKPEIIPGFHFCIIAINSKRQSSFLFSFKVDLVLLLAILNGLKNFWWYFIMFANSRNIMKRDMDKFNLTQFECRIRNLKNLLANRKKLSVFFLLLSFWISQINHTTTSMWRCFPF